MQASNYNGLSRVINFTSTYEVWKFLITTHKGTSQVKRPKIDILCSQYENFYMHDNEFIDDMVARFTKITNGLSSLVNKIDNDQIVRKIIRALSTTQEVKSTTLRAQ